MNGIDPSARFPHLATIGDLGQRVTGVSTADAATQVITLASSPPAGDYPVINALQLRTVSEPSSALLLVCAATFCLRRRTARERTGSPGSVG